MGNKACFCCDEPVNVSAPQTQELMDVDVINRVEEEVEDPVLLQAVFHHLESFSNYSSYQNPSTINLMRT